jgi:hypothetical protein
LIVRVVADANVLVSAALARDDVLDAAEQMAQASKGMLHVTRTDGAIRVPGTLDELRRRLKDMTGDNGEPRRRGTFRSSP